MSHRKTITWIAVLDGKCAHFYTKGEEPKLGELNHTMTARPIRTDTPTGRRELGRSFDSVGGGRHVIEPHTSDRTLERQSFMREVADYLEKALKQKKYNRLVVSAPPKILGFLRKELGADVKNVIALEVDKDFAEYSPQELQEHLEKVVHI